MNYLDNLKKLVNSENLILLYTDYDDKDKFSVGFPVAVINDEWIALKSLDTHGFFDGYLLKRVDMVWKIETDDLYKTNLEKLWNFRNCNGQCNVSELSFENVTSISNLLSSVKHEVISVTNQHREYFLGDVCEVDEKSFSILECDLYGYEDSKLNFCFDDVISIKIRGIDETDLNVILNKSI